MYLARITVLSFAVCFFSCKPFEVIVREQIYAVPVGGSCTANEQCKNMRCVGGVCDDGKCGHDADCLPGEICEKGNCVKASAFICKEGRKASLSLSPSEIIFPQVPSGDTNNQSIILRNTSDCSLTILGIGIDNNPSFTCSLCDMSLFPVSIAPNHDISIDVIFSPRGLNDSSSALLIKSNADNSLTRVPLRLSSVGQPVLVLEPAELNFGYFKFSPDFSNEHLQTIRIENRGTGNAKLFIQSISLEKDNAFSVPTEFSRISPDVPSELKPYDANDPSTYIDVPVYFRPGERSDFDNKLIVYANFGDPQKAFRIVAPITGSTLGAPKLLVSPPLLTFDHDVKGAVTLGETRQQIVKLANIGDSDLTVSSMSLSLASSSEFSYSPSFIPPIAPGKSFNILVSFAPTQPSDKDSQKEPQVPIFADLQVNSNDGENPTSQVKLHGYSREPDNDVLRMEMVFENSETSWAANDFRDVSLELTSASGFSCAEPEATFSPAGELVFKHDYCGDWNSYGLDGKVNWVALGQYKEPERITLYGLGSDLADGEIFKVRIHYLQDCSNMPSGMLADIVGVSVGLLFGVLSGVTGIPLGVNPQQIRQLVANNCWQHSSSLTTVQLYLNGKLWAYRSVNLNKAGDYATVFTLRRKNGRFELVQ